MAISILHNHSATWATSVQNGDIAGNGDINFVTPLSQAVLTIIGMVLVSDNKHQPYISLLW